jgi:hypothetical protein
MLFAKEQLPEQVVNHSMRLWYYALSRSIEKMGKMASSESSYNLQPAHRMALPPAYIRARGSLEAD